MLRGWEPGIQEGAESASGWADRVVCRNGYMRAPVGKGTVASRVDGGGGLSDLHPLTCLYSAASVLGPCKTWTTGVCGASLMILPVASAFCLHRMLSLDMGACLIVWQSS